MTVAYTDTVQRTWRENILFSALIELTYRCNLDCFFCYNDLGQNGTPLSTEQYFRFFEDLRNLGTMNLTLTGGEPLAHPDFFSLGSKARELGFVVRLKSNGHGLRKCLARRLKDEVDPFLVEVSLHGARAETHDRQTRVAGSFERLTANIEAMLDSGLRVKVNSALTAWNENEMQEMFDLTDRLGVPLTFDPEVTPRDDGDRTPLSIGASRQGILRLFELQMERSRKAAASDGDTTGERKAGGPCGATVDTGGKHCGAGSAGVAVDPYGNVYPCVQWRQSVGNLHEQPIEAIWRGSATLDEIRSLTVEAKRTVDGYGDRGRAMAFCPGSARMNAGDPVQVYPAALLRMELAQQAAKRLKSTSGVATSDVP